MKKIARLVLAIGIALLSACSALAPEPTPTPTPIPPTSTPIPTPTATPLPPSAWRDTWTVWKGEEREEITMDFKVVDNNLTTTFVSAEGDEIDVEAIISEDEKTITGTWSSKDGSSGSIHARLSEDENQLVGNLSGETPICASKAGAEMPDPCGLNWSGEWQVWLGPDQYNSTVVYIQEGDSVTGQAKSAQGYRYDFKGLINEDGSIATGTWSAMVLGGEFEVYMADNMIQFSGNLDGEFPLCGARWGAPKPDTCLVP